MEQNRIGLYQFLLNEGRLPSSIKNYSDFKSGYFNDGPKVELFWNYLISTKQKVRKNEYYYNKTLSEFYKSYCCDLEWAKTTTYCGGGPTPTPTPSTPPGPPPITPPPGPNPIHACSETNATGADVISGTLIKKCVKGNIVGEIQKYLKKHGFGNFSKSGNIDNIFGSKTEKMVIDFQTSKGLTPDGIVGPKTWVELVKDKSSKPSVTKTPKPKPTPDQGPTGEEDIINIEF